MRYKKKKNHTVYLSEYIEDEQDFKNVLVHELIHFSCTGHKSEFKEFMYKINNLGYDVRVTCKIQKLNQIAKEKRTKRQKYKVSCTSCGWTRIYLIKHDKLDRYRCPSCGKTLRQKLIKDD